MEFFEKAHIEKSKEMKGKKSENVKKQLKQMLHGYKVSDNRLIERSADVDTDFEESSVSGFSDLNITNSSPENDSNDNQSVTLNEESGTDVNENTSSSGTTADNTLEPIAHCSKESIIQNKKITSSDESEDDDSEEHEFSSGEDETSSISESETQDSSHESEKSEEFDADGALAATILKKLKINTKQKSVKRKHSELDSPSCSSKKPTYSKIAIEKPSKKKKEHKSQTKQPEVQQKSESLEDEPVSSPYWEAIEDQNTNSSSDFVSITATDIPDQQLTDVIGEYRNPVISILPIDNKKIFSKNQKENFATEMVENSQIVEPRSPMVEQNITEPINTDVEPEVTSELSNQVQNPSEEYNTGEEDDIEQNENTTFDDTLENTDPLQCDEIDPEENIRIIANAEKKYKIYYFRSYCIIIMKHPAEIYVHGKVKVRALGGVVQIMGHILTGNSCEIYAPYYNHAHCLRTTGKPNYFYGLFNKLTTAGISVAEAENIVTTSGDRDGIIFLHQLQSKAMDFVESCFKVTNIFAKQQRTFVDPFFAKASDILNCSLFSVSPWKSYVDNPDWKDANESAQENLSRGFVCGGKGTGKSTYLRFQVNRLLPKGHVLVLDLDPGQSEFTPAGNISATVVQTPILGPSYTHLQQPEMQINVGLINPMDNIKRYTTAVVNLVRQCQTHATVSKLRWIVNTMGITTPVGLKLMVHAILLVNPTYLVQYYSKSPKRRFEKEFKSTVVKLLYLDLKNENIFKDLGHPNLLNYDFHLINEMETLTRYKTLNPKEARYLNFLAYFGQLITPENPTLLGIVPYKVDMADLYIGTNVVVKDKFLSHVINGKVVALCQNRGQYVPKAFYFSDRTMRCFGYGVIRGVDWEKGVYYVITPVPAKSLGCVNTLLYADWVPELVGLEHQLPKGTVVPYRTLTQDQHKQLMSTPHRRFNPLQLLKMAKSS